MNTEIILASTASVIVVLLSAIFVTMSSHTQEHREVQPSVMHVEQEPSEPVQAPQPQHQPYTIAQNSLLYNTVPILTLGEDEMFNRRWYTTPGASFDGLKGLNLQDAFQFISNTFPQLTVRAVPIGEPISLEFRRDRVTVQYDSYNKKVISARIG